VCVYHVVCMCECMCVCVRASVCTSEYVCACVEEGCSQTLGSRFLQKSSLPGHIFRITESDGQSDSGNLEMD